MFVTSRGGGKRDQRHLLGRKEGETLWARKTHGKRKMLMTAIKSYATPVFTTNLARTETCGRGRTVDGGGRFYKARLITNNEI